MENKREYDKYVVFKRDELNYVFQANPLLKKYFEVTGDLVLMHRISCNKKPVNRYVVCNQDESYAEDVWKLILGKEDKERPTEQNLEVDLV